MSTDHPDRAPTTPIPTAGPGQWLIDRRDFLHLTTAPRADGQGGYDVLLRIDGSYAEPEMAEHMADYFAGVLAGLLGGPIDVVPEATR